MLQDKKVLDDKKNNVSRELMSDMDTSSLLNDPLMDIEETSEEDEEPIDNSQE